MDNYNPDEKPLGIFSEIPFQNKQMNKYRTIMVQIMIWVWIISILSLAGEILSATRDHETVVIKITAMLLTIIFAPILAMIQSLALILR